MKKLLLFMLSCVLLLISLRVAFVWWDRGAPPGFQPEIVDVTLDTITRNHRGVRITGMARYDVRIKVGENYIYPLMNLKKFNKKTIKVMISSPKKPSRLASLEEMTVEGLARPPGGVVNQEVYNAWRRKGFEFTEKFVLVESFEKVPPAAD